MKRRLWVVLAALALWIGALGARLYELQIVDLQHYRDIARRQQMDIVELEPPRGTIYDARGRELAVSVNAESLFANPRAIEDPQVVAKALAGVLKLDSSDLARKLESDRGFVWVQRKLDPPVAQAVRELGLQGLDFVDESKRYYPFRQLAGHLLGFVGTDHDGLEGLEAAYNRIVAGRSARRTVLRDAYRKRLGSPEHLFPEPEPGRDLHLTIDATIQHIAERELAAAVEDSNAKGGSVVILDPHSGAILAMTSMPLFDPNRFAAVDASTWRIRPITDVFEPGSTFKMVTVATALEANLVDPNDLIDCERGGITINRMRIRDHHPYDLLTVRDVLAKSSNVGAIKIGLIAGPERLDRQVRAFGFGRRTGIDLPGESPGMLNPRESWAPMTEIYMSFGHGLAVTSLQLANSFAAVANGGVLYKPYLVRGTGRGAQIEAIDRPVSAGRVLHPATARSVERLLEAVVETGTAKRAQIPGYRVAGKTGTPQKLDESGRGYSRSAYMASFAGFAPARRPAVVCLVIIDEPAGGAEGGVVAAPAFRKIVSSVLNYLRVPPSAATDPEWPRVAELEPDEEKSLDWGSQVEPLRVASHDETVVPDLSGMTARQAMVRLAENGLTPQLNGSGFVVRQMPVAGTPVTDVESLELWLASGPSGF